MNEIIAQIDSEIARLEEVRKLLSSSSLFSSDGTSRPKASGKPRHKKRTLSAEARKKIAEAQRKRWATQGAKK